MKRFELNESFMNEYSFLKILFINLFHSILHVSRVCHASRLAHASLRHRVPVTLGPRWEPDSFTPWASHSR